MLYRLHLEVKTYLTYRQNYFKLGTYVGTCVRVRTYTHTLFCNIEIQKEKKQTITKTYEMYYLYTEETIDADSYLHIQFNV